MYIAGLQRARPLPCASGRRRRLCNCGPEMLLQGSGEDLVDEGQRLAAVPKEVLPPPERALHPKRPAGRRRSAHSGGRFVSSADRRRLPPAPPAYTCCLPAPTLPLPAQ